MMAWFLLFLLRTGTRPPLPARSQDAPLRAPGSRACLGRTGDPLGRMATARACPRQKADIVPSIDLTVL